MDQSGRRKIIAGGKLRRLRQELNLSQSGMAQELGISLSYLNLVERNQRPVTAQVLIKLAEVYGVDAGSFASEDDPKPSRDLEEILADPLFETLNISKAEMRDVADASVATVDALKRLYRAYADLRELQSAALGVTADAERGSTVPPDNDPIERLRDFLQQSTNYFPELEMRAESIAAELSAEQSHFFSAVCTRLQRLHDIRVQVVPADVLPQTLRRFDMHRRKLMISELVEPSGRAFQAAIHLALAEAGDVLDLVASRIDKPGTTTHAMGRIMLANYFAAALMMPYGRFHEAAEQLGYDVDVLSARFSASFEQVAHRLTTLGRPGAKGIPFFMIRVDIAGNISKRFSSGSFPFARFGGTCPRWHIHQAFRSPGMISTQFIELPDASHFFSIARTVRQIARHWGEPDSQFVVGLGCEIKHAPRLVYAKAGDMDKLGVTPIGVNCRLCERNNCSQRSAPPLMRKLEVNENIRGLSPFDSVLRR